MIANRIKMRKQTLVRMNIQETESSQIKNLLRKARNKEQKKELNNILITLVVKKKDEANRIYFLGARGYIHEKLACMPESEQEQSEIAAKKV